MSLVLNYTPVYLEWEAGSCHEGKDRRLVINKQRRLYEVNTFKMWIKN